MRRIHDRVVGLDVHKKSVTACAEWLTEVKEVRNEKKQFSTTAKGVRELAGWLHTLGVTHVVMESTGVYWKPVFYGLEDNFDVILVNAAHVKNLPGRKTDMSDAQWLADVAAHGMVRASLVPGKGVRGLRELTRYRKQLIKMRTQEIQRLEKLFQDAGIKFTNVASKVWLKSSQNMIQALIDGETDPVVLAKFAKGSLAKRQDELVEALENRWTDYHSVLAKQLADHIQRIDESVKQVSTEIADTCEPWKTQIELLYTVPGVSTMSAEAIIAETSGDMSKFATADHLASWCGLTPGNNQSAGKTRTAKTLRGNSTIKTVMTEVAQVAARTDPYLKAKKARIAKRRGPNKATIAVARTIMIGIWHVLTNNEPWKNPGVDQNNRDLQQKANWHINRTITRPSYPVS